MTQAKPILVLRTPEHIEDGVMKELNSGVKRLTGNEYHVLLIQDSNVEEIAVEVYNVHDEKPINIEELKALLKHEK